MNQERNPGNVPGTESLSIRNQTVLSGSGTESLGCSGHGISEYQGCNVPGTESLGTRNQIVLSGSGTESLECSGHGISEYQESNRFEWIRDGILGMFRARNL